MVYNGDNIEVLKQLDANSVDAVVTDPPYGLSFMGKKWDYDVPTVDFWREVLRVLKPGGHVLSFGGTRTYHRMVVNIEDAGFEIRDQVMWLYGSGFPKSHNIGKKIKEWDGWGTALKPANEPIVLARKPLSEKTIVDNVLKWGTGAINIDECRIEIDFNCGGHESSKNTIQKTSGIDFKGNKKESQSTPLYNNQGRWPANLLLDETAAEMLDEQSGPIKTKLPFKKTSQHTFGVANKDLHKGQKFESQKGLGITVTGASRFFYVAKASKRERGSDNNHPTVKPIKLMQYLIKLITPPNGTVLDPFMGSGSTGVACKELGIEFIGIELNKEYYEIANGRIDYGHSKSIGKI